MDRKNCFNSPFEDGVALQGGERCGQSIEAHHHPEVIADPDGTSEGGVQGQLPLPLLEEALDLVLWNRPLVVEDEDLVGEDPAVEVSPVAAAHVSPDRYVPGPYIPLDPPVGHVCHGEHGAEGEVHVQDLAAVDCHFEVVDEPPVGAGLGHDLDAGLPGTSGDGCRVFLHRKYVPSSRKLHGEHVHRGREVTRRCSSLENLCKTGEKKGRIAWIYLDSHIGELTATLFRGFSASRA